MIGLIAALAIQAITADGWVEGGASLDGDQIYYKAGPQADMVWVRIESVEGAARSFRVLMQADCQDGTIRMVQGRAFSEPNMTGSGTELYATTYQYPAPDTVQKGFFDVICAP